MPPKVRITREDIVSCALQMVRESGPQAINARTVAKVLGCSTQPVFSNFETMENLQLAVEEKAYELYLSFLKADAESGKYPTYKALGMAYIRFASEEKELFKLLFMCDRKGDVPLSSVDFSASVDIIMEATGVDRKKAELIHLEMWVFVHGIATMLATSYLTLKWELISDMVSDIYHGIRQKHLSEEEK